MRVDHRGADIAMPKQLLHTTNIYPRVEQVRRERVPLGTQTVMAIPNSLANLIEQTN